MTLDIFDLLSLVGDMLPPRDTNDDDEDEDDEEDEDEADDDREPAVIREPDEDEWGRMVAVHQAEALRW
jgi:hypothetical protein